MFKKRIAALALCALLVGCTASSGTNQPFDRDSLPKYPPFDYFTVCYYNSMKSRVYSEDNEIDYFLADELHFLTHRGFGFSLDPQDGWSSGGSDWTLFQNISALQADQPIFKAALETPDPTEDMQWEFIENEAPWVKFVWSENFLITPEGDAYPLRDQDPAPDDTIQTIRHIAIFLESPEKEGRLDCVIFTQNPATGEYLYWEASTTPELGVWFRQELAIYAWYEIL